MHLAQARLSGGSEILKALQPPIFDVELSARHLEVAQNGCTRSLLRYPLPLVINAAKTANFSGEYCYIQGMGIPLNLRVLESKPVRRQKCLNWEAGSACPLMRSLERSHAETEMPQSGSKEATYLRTVH